MSTATPITDPATLASLPIGSLVIVKQRWRTNRSALVIDRETRGHSQGVVILVGEAVPVRQAEAGRVVHSLYRRTAQCIRLHTELASDQVWHVSGDDVVLPAAVTARAEAEARALRATRALELANQERMARVARTMATRFSAPKRGPYPASVAWDQLVPAPAPSASAPSRWAAPSAEDAMPTDVANLLARARVLLRDHGLEALGWTVETSTRMVRNAGMCYYQDRVIRLSHAHTTTMRPADAWDTVTHEVAHALAWVRHGRSAVGANSHGEQWRAIHRELGGTGHRTHSNDAPVRAATAAWVGTCDCSGQTEPRIQRHRRTSGAHFRDCRHPVVWVRST